MRGHGMGRTPIFRGPPVARGPYMQPHVRPYVRRTSGFLGLLMWLFPGLAGFWLGKSYGASSQTMTDREAELQRREAELRRREELLEQQSER